MKLYPWGFVNTTAVLVLAILALAAPSRTWAEDAYEPNNTRATAYDLSASGGSWLSAINGLGQQSDNDWYSFTISQDLGQIVIDCTFTNDLGDIDIELYDATGSVPIGRSVSTADQEVITLCAPAAGTYYLKVYTQIIPTDNLYDLRWQELPPCADDACEPNDFAEQAYNITSRAGTWLSTAVGTLYQADEDWYQITVPDGQQYVDIECTFTDADGDIDLELYDGTKTNLVADAISKTDDERIALCVPAGGTYYLRVYFDNQGNPYDLWWEARSCRWETCGAVDLGENWWWLDWFAYFNRVFDPWIYHEQHRFLYPFGDDCTGLVFWDNSMQAFWWTSASVYPYVYRFSDNEWLYYLMDSVDPRWFNILSQDIWEQW